MKSRLGDICQVQMGYPFRFKLERSDADNCISVIQMKDIGENGYLNIDDLVPVEMEDIKGKYRLQKNDIIFKSRGHLNNAAHVAYALKNAVVASPLMVLKVADKGVLPAYLAWNINQPHAQRQIESMASGTSVRMISKADLEDLEIPIPPVTIQKQIIKIAELCQREQALLHELAVKRKKLLEASLITIANEK